MGFNFSISISSKAILQKPICTIFMKSSYLFSIGVLLMAIFKLSQNESICSSLVSPNTFISLTKYKYFSCTSVLFSSE